MLRDEDCPRTVWLLSCCFVSRLCGVVQVPALVLVFRYVCLCDGRFADSDYSDGFVLFCLCLYTSCNVLRIQLRMQHKQQRERESKTEQEHTQQSAQQRGNRGVYVIVEVIVCSPRGISLGEIGVFLGSKFI